MPTLTRRTLGALAGAALLLAGTAGVAPAADQPKRGGTLVATWGGGEPQAAFVPAGGGSSPFISSTKVLERLLKLNLALEFEPVLAESVTAAPDFKSYTIFVRKGVKWHDGKDLTADDVAFSITDYWKPISSGPVLKTLEGVEVKDSHTVVVRFTQPLPELTFKAQLAGQGGLILPKHVYAGTDIVTNPANNAPIGTGPWKFKSWSRGSHIEFAPNENYWQAGQPYLDKLILRYFRDPAARAAALEAGELHLAVFNPIPVPEVKRLTNTGKFVADTHGFENSAWALTLDFNTRNPVLAKREVRQALLHAIDRNFIAQTVYYGYARPGTSPILTANALFHTENVPVYGFDPAKAGALLDAAGLPRKADGKRFAVNLLAAGWFEENGKVGAYLKQALEDVGVQVTLTVPDRPTSIKRIYTDYDFDLAVSNNTTGVEPFPVTTQYYTTDGIVKGAAFRNANGFSNQELDALVERIAVETDPGKRKELVQEFARFAATEVPIVQLLELDPVNVAASYVRNHSNAANYLGESWGDLWLDR
ncbi:peptide/nickel transport system substrate-binding protein [Azospirillum baldaniorum]|uniref:ABC transporter substrate-binding protein n=1 Tax=Azospirillum baldaniorum TaxID=1064539 RepID=UPI0011ADC1E4|nr:ABC transporter substrate-binding protein [Azospirillum baldaniorum]TWA57396.1 peptide/nickel transport system substrate-binding protein [Azospirillum baldaniorum]